MLYCLTIQDSARKALSIHVQAATIDARVTTYSNKMCPPCDQSRFPKFVQKMFCFLNQRHMCDLSAFATDAACQLNILGHDCDTLCMDRAEVGILKQSNQVCFTGFLQGQDSGRLKTKIRLEVLSDFTHKALEWCLADQEVCGFLILANFAKGNSSRTIPMWLLDTSSGGSRLAGSLSEEKTEM